MRGREVQEYHVFLASPGDVQANAMRFEPTSKLSRTAGAARGVRFQVVDWENYSTAGLGRPQELITRQVLERFRTTLALVIVIMAQRFGTPTGASDSGTEEEVRWALESHADCGFPEVKFFFRDIEQFIGPTDPNQLAQAVDQWQRVRKFRQDIETSRSALYKTYSEPADFEAILRDDMAVWFHDEARPWSATPVAAPPVTGDPLLHPTKYFQESPGLHRVLTVHRQQLIRIPG